MITERFRDKLVHMSQDIRNLFVSGYHLIEECIDIKVPGRIHKYELRGIGVVTRKAIRTDNLEESPTKTFIFIKGKGVLTDGFLSDTHYDELYLPVRGS